MKTKHFRLVLNVEFDPQGESSAELKANLNQVVRDAVNEGTLTGDSPATVEDYDFTVTEIKPKKKRKLSKDTRTPLCPSNKELRDIARQLEYARRIQGG